MPYLGAPGPVRAPPGGGDRIMTRAESYRRGYEHLYQANREMLEQGHSANYVRSVNRMADLAKPDPPNLSPHEAETRASIAARAQEDAISNRPPEPVWGDLDQPLHDLSAGDFDPCPRK